MKAKIKLLNRHFFLKLMFLGFLLGTTKTYCQIQWITDENLALYQALQQDKLLVVDFWAPWCKPCLVLDQKVWDTQTMNDYNDQFVFLKINIDGQSILRNFFDVQQIPLVQVMDISNFVYSKSLGITSLNYYQRELEKFDLQLYDLNRLLSFKLNRKMSSGAYLRLGTTYRNIGLQFKEKAIRNHIIDHSSKQYQEVLEKSLDSLTLQKAELQLMINEAYQGKLKKATRKLKEYTFYLTDDEVNQLKKELEKLLL